jgi:hypothetical protein
MFDDIRQKLNDIKIQIKQLKQNKNKEEVMQQYLVLTKLKAETEAELNAKKAAYYLEISKIKNKEARKKLEHFKFILGGLLLKFYPQIEQLQGKSGDELEKAFKEFMSLLK